MVKTPEVQEPPSSPQTRPRWTLMAAAPGWFRRIWTERSREVPKQPEAEANRLRRISYL